MSAMLQHSQQHGQNCDHLMEHIPRQMLNSIGYDHCSTVELKGERGARCACLHTIRSSIHGMVLNSSYYKVTAGCLEYFYISYRAQTDTSLPT